MNANETQVGGTHYKSEGLQHWDLIERHHFGYLEGYASRYIERRKKNKKEDLEKALHCVNKLMELNQEGIRTNTGSIWRGKLIKYTEARPHMTPREKIAFIELLLWETAEDLQCVALVLQEEIDRL